MIAKPAIKSSESLFERYVAWGVFAFALLLYLSTVAPTASFWDSGEFIAIANRLEVSHPPGAPVFMLIGRLFSMFVPVQYIAFSVNLISVLASALTILLTHLIIVRLIREWQGNDEERTVTDRIAAVTGGVIGACTFAVSDSFWFNAVEAEVYALSMLFTAAVVWLILRWSDLAREEEALMAGGQHLFGLAANRYLLLIAYLFGLAIGVHLLNLLAIFFIALIIFYTEKDRPEHTTGQRFAGLVVTGIISSLAFVTVYPGIVQVLPDLAGQTGSLLLFMVVLVGLLVAAIHITHRNRMQAANLAVLGLTMVMIGYSSYALIFIRSAADPPIDENDPETTEAIVSYLKREQYGSTPLLSGATFDGRQIDYEKEVSFPRRHSPEPTHWRVYTQYDSDLEFFLKYQVGHMYLRYFGWNFIGRASDIQDAPVITGFRPDEGAQYFFQTPSERASRNIYYGLPFILGMIGLMHHFKRDWRRAFAVLVLFAVSGIGIIVYLNQPPLQPRERDYSYVASFFAYSLWIGIGAAGVIELVGARLRDQSQSALVIGTAALLFLIVPGWMLYQNYDDHDRSGRYVAPDYAYNMLMSLEENAVVFTNGDNDTFPLWYLQEVEGVRQDVRVANLSLLNTPWYTRQLASQHARASAPLPIDMTEKEIAELRPRAFEPREIALPVDRNLFAPGTELASALGDTIQFESPMRWNLRGRVYPFDERVRLLHAADQVALNMIVTNAAQGWRRPIYFAVTVSPDGRLDLQNYFQLEGQALRVVPIRHNEAQLGRVVPSISAERLKNFRFRNLDNPDVYYDENIRNMCDNYRTVFAHTAEKMAQAGEVEQARVLLDTIMEKVPFDVIPGDERSYLFMARGYQQIGDADAAVNLIKGMEPVILHRLQWATSPREIEYLAQFVQMIRISYLEANDLEAGANFYERLADITNDSSYDASARELRALDAAVRNSPLPDSTIETVPLDSIDGR